MKNLYTGILLTALAFTSCSKLDQVPQSTASKDAIFSSENGLKLYTNSFYGMDFLPKNATTGDQMTDYLAVKAVPDFIRQGGYAANTSSGWTWRDLRNINYFIANCNNPAIPENIRNNYLGIARYFRAYFYAEKVKRFGNVPWIGKPLEIDDPTLTAGRDARTLVMDSVLADLNFACANIIATNDPTRTTITKWVAFAYKSRVCLFEGTFRKYHTNLNLTSSANTWLQEAASAADQIIKNGGYSINTAGGPGVSYRQVFTSNTPLTNEVLQAAVADVSLGVLSDANWWWTSGTYGAKASLTRTFINTYLNLDGTPFTNNPAYPTMLFKDEVKNRDLRLKQTIRSGDYKRVNNGALVAAPPVFSYTFTGYQPIKLTLDDTYFDAGALKYQCRTLVPLCRSITEFCRSKSGAGYINRCRMGIYHWRIEDQGRNYGRTYHEAGDSRSLFNSKLFSCYCRPRYFRNQERAWYRTKSGRISFFRYPALEKGRTDAAGMEWLLCAGAGNTA